MKRLEQLIDMARTTSGNTRYDANSGIPQKVFVQFFNNAQDSLTKAVVNLKTKYLLKTGEAVPVVSGQEVYSLPDDVFMQHIDTISWVQNLNDKPLPLENTTSKEKLSKTVGYPFAYQIKNEAIYLNPPITSGYLLQDYIRRKNNLQIKNGVITAVTLVGQTLSALTVATTGAYDTAAINDDYYLCVVDKYGVQKAKNITYTSEASGVFTLSSQTLGSGQTVAVGDYIVVGKNCTNLPEWPDIVESYLLKHVGYDVKFMDGSSWTKEAKQDLADSFSSLAGSFATLNEDITEIPITNSDLLVF